jgi:hypothetical protein
MGLPALALLSTALPMVNGEAVTPNLAAVSN